MSWVENKGIKYYQFELFEDKKIVQGIFSRHGGISPEPWNSLNLGGTVGDSQKNVVENRLRIFNQINRPVQSIFDVWQVHGINVVCTDKPRPLDTAHQRADAILTDRPEITLLMRFADCTPIFLFDPIKKATGIVHAGWQGTIHKVAKEAVEAMCQKYHSRPEDIHAGIGPSIGPDHYEIKEDVAIKVNSAFGSDAGMLLHEKDHKLFYNLWESNRLVLEQAGLKHIQIANVCTACNTKDWYSHRAENGKTGRFGAILAIMNG